jgi:uncharacterized lipoprotein YmbA
MKKGIRLLILTGGCALLLSSCATTPSSNQYRLLALAEPVEAGSGGSPGTVRLLPVTVPAALQRPVIVTWDGGALLSSSEFERWADTLESLIQEALTANVSARVPEADFVRGRLHPGIRADIDLNVEILEFDRISGQEAVLALRWSLSGNKRSGSLHQWQGRQDLDGNDVQAYVLAQSRLLAEAAEAIAATIRGNGMD